MSREAVRRSEYLITDLLAKFLNILSDYASGARPVDLSLGTKCLTADISMNYAFQRPFNALDAEYFLAPLLTSVDGLTTLFLWPAYFPRTFGALARLVAGLPRWFKSRYLKPFAAVDWALEVSEICLLLC